MHNPQMLGLGRVDHFNMKGSMCVIALFGVVTIVSYFNELNKAGLLRRGVVPQPLHHNLLPRRVERSLVHDTTIHKNGDLHQLGLQIVNIKKNSNLHNKRGQEINIKLHLGQNASYEKSNNSVVPIYNHKNTLPNFYTTLNMSLYNISTFNMTHVQTNMSLPPVRLLEAQRVQLESQRAQYQKAVLVFAHQHEPHAYLLRDCLRDISHQHGLAINNLPINWSHRKQWDAMSRHKRNSFQVLYGGLTFGVCESISRPCSYMTLVSHPVDRLVAVYNLCVSHNLTGPVRQLCRQNNAHTKHTKQQTLKDFIVAHGSSFFEKLVYYAKNCRLIGDDEICLQGARTSFVLTAEEADAHLRHILLHLEAWFSAVGLVEHLHESLSLFKGIYGYDFNTCYKHREVSEWMQAVRESSDMKSLVLTKKQRKLLLKDSDIQLALQADMAIYGKVAEIYQRQVKNSKRLTKYLHLSQKAIQEGRLADRREKARLKAARQADKATKHKDKHKGVDGGGHGSNKTAHVKESNSKGHGNVKHPKGEPNSTQVERTHTGGILGSITRMIFPELPQAAAKSRKDHVLTGGRVGVEGLDAMMYQNLSALELSKFHAEGVRPGTLEKANAVHLRHLPNPGVTVPGKHKHKPNGNKPNGNKPNSNKPNGNKPNGNKPNGNKPNRNKPNGNKPNGNKPNGNKGPKKKN